ncbi:glycine-tRNA ligase [Pneumocystis carinii B80]|uniref:glycine--tRNA ligase n=1 Tax=Pneumocystis carinii (strain B80) TaxID=1408658 RepID=A0A0W4ZT30_PNEC8|nr:glycine-tRNA ligase [Pneumocystis carinii B80]KTW31550.1 glycine-tRNA ligase [Pneumocystis carinii B80]
MAVNTENPGFCRSRLEELLKKRFFYCPSYEIYGGVSGLYDYGPPGMALEQNILNVWRKHFVYEENMLEIGTSIVTPHEVLETSGHVSKFRDWMCKDPSTGEVFRADHIIKEILLSRIKKRVESGLEGEKVEGGASGTKFDTLDESLSRIREYEDIISRIDGYDGEGLSRVIEEYDIRNPATNVRMEGPVGFNLMFATEIGPKGNMTGYLRPETAQGQFLNFNKLLEFNNGKMPFASVVVGKSFRNEISPRSGLLRMREFTMAEIEHYVDPLNKDHRRFNEVENVKMKFLTREIQMSGKEEVIEMKIGEAVARGILENTTLAYFLARIHLFLIRIGMNKEKLRFRQHMNNEMAHYASDCWDAELLTSYGWIECVGCADRAAYDLTVHSEKTKEKLVVRELLPKPMEVTEWVVNVDKKKIGPLFKKDLKVVEQAISSWSNEDKIRYRDQAASEGRIVVKVEDGREFEIPSSLFTIEQVKKTISVREYIPNVIEPSFGIGRILYSLIEHSYWIRSDDVDRCVLSFPPIVAPVKCLLVPLSNNSAFDPIIDKLSFELRQLGISHKVDDSSAAIGRRYSRNDELGTPFGITVDFQTVNDGSLTLRERDTTRQIRASEKEILRVIKELSEGLISWDDVLKDFPIFNKQITDIPEITDLYIRE